MAIVKQYDKRSGITYAYEATYHWDKEKKQSRCTRKLIGRIDDRTGDIIATDGRCRKDKTAKNEKKHPSEGLLQLHRPDICIMERHIFWRSSLMS